MNDVSHAQQTFSTSCVWWWRWRRPWRRSVRLTKLQEVQVSGGVAQTCMTHVSWSGVAQLEWPTILSDGRMNRYKDGHLSQVTMEVLHMANHTGALPGSSWGWWHHRRSGPSFSERLRCTSLHAEHLFTSSPCISIGLYWDLIQFFPLKLRNLHHDFRSFSSPPPQKEPCTHHSPLHLNHASAGNHNLISLSGNLPVLDFLCEWIMECEVLGVRLLRSASCFQCVHEGPWSIYLAFRVRIK